MHNDENLHIASIAIKQGEFDNKNQYMRYRRTVERLKKTSLLLHGKQTEFEIFARAFINIDRLSLDEETKRATYLILAGGYNG